MQLPSNDEIQAAAQRLGLLDPDGQLAPGNRAKVVNQLLAEQRRGPADPNGQLLSRSVIKVADGQLVVEVRHIPEPPPQGS